MEFKGKKVIITGANGLVGLPTVKKCLDEGAERVYAVDLRIGDNLKFLQTMYLSNEVILVVFGFKIYTFSYNDDSIYKISTTGL
jgi:nucleoside-diphosphate-sugar epimerase